MSGNVIKSFLVGLGFSVDQTQLAKFNKAIASAALKVTGLFVAVKLTAAGIFYGISKISESFEDLGYSLRIITPLVNKTLLLRDAMLSAYKAAGINIHQAVAESFKFNISLAKTKFALESIYKSVGVRFLPLLTKQMDIFRKNLYNNLPKIQEFLDKFIKFVFKIFESTNVLGARLWSILESIYEQFVKLHKATNGWSTAIIAVAVAVQLLNKSFLNTPLGRILAVSYAILELYDDYKTFQEHGKSLINWNSLFPASVVDTIKTFVSVFKELYEILEKLFGSVNRVGEKLRKLFTDFGSKVINFVIKEPNIKSNISPQNNPTQGSLVNPVGSNIQNKTSNINNHVNQQANITVQESADANATGQHISDQLTKLNYNIARNMSGNIL